MTEKELFEYLTRLAENISQGSYGCPDELFELTRTGFYPDEICRMAEAFGMMLVKLEARELHLGRTISELTQAKAELEAAKKLLEERNKTLSKSLRESFSPMMIIGTGEAMKNLQSMIGRVAATPVNVLITGESGTGKELAAKALHYQSDRANEPFVALNCGAIPENLVEAELFGIEKGVATGVDRRAGKLELAGEGTLFLDEVAEMPPGAQVKLLRVLQEKKLERVGGSKSIEMRARIVAATNRDLRTEVAEGRFREDLYYRLKVVCLHMPPLRDRKEDVPVLFRHFLDLSSARFGRQKLKFSRALTDALAAYDWPGNIRELSNEAERLAALAFSDVLELSMLSDEIRLSGGFFADGEPLNEKDEVLEALEKTEGNRTRAAELLGISREGLRKKMIRLEIK